MYIYVNWWEPIGEVFVYIVQYIEALYFFVWKYLQISHSSSNV